MFLLYFVVLGICLSGKFTFFLFLFYHLFQNMEQFEDIGPSVVLASPGMMQSGLSRELFEAWCIDKRNGVIIAGYCVEGTLAKVL